VTPERAQSVDWRHTVDQIRRRVERIGTRKAGLDLVQRDIQARRAAVQQQQIAGNR
jgi:hypothetical protein